MHADTRNGVCPLAALTKPTSTNTDMLVAEGNLLVTLRSEEKNVLKLFLKWPERGVRRPVYRESRERYASSNKCRKARVSTQMCIFKLGHTQESIRQSIDV